MPRGGGRGGATARPSGARELVRHRSSTAPRSRRHRSLRRSPARLLRRAGREELGEGLLGIAARRGQLLRAEDGDDGGQRGAELLAGYSHVAIQHGALAQLLPRHVGRKLRRLGENLRRLLRVAEDPRPGALVLGKDGPHDVGVRLQEVLARVQHAEGVEIDVAKEKPRAGLELGGGQVRVEPAPGVHLPALERRAPLGMLEVHQLDVALLQAVCCKRAEQEEEGVRPAGDGDLLSSQLGHRLQRRALRHRERGPLGLAEDVHGLQGHPVGAGEERGRAGRRRKVGASAGEELVGLVASLAEDPGDLRPVPPEGLLEPAELLQHQAARVVGGMVEADLAERLGERDGRQQEREDESDAERHRGPPVGERWSASSYLRPRTFWVRRSTSARTPAAVTSPPAPAPRTMSGYSRYRAVVKATRASAPRSGTAGCPSSTATGPTRTLRPSAPGTICIRYRSVLPAETKRCTCAAKAASWNTSDRRKSSGSSSARSDASTKG